MAADSATTLEQEVHRLFELLDSMDLRRISAMLTNDAQGIDEISRRWMRGKPALETYFAQLELCGSVRASRAAWR